MQQRNKLLSVFMSFTLALTLFGAPAYADGTDRPDEGGMTQEANPVDAGGDATQKDAGASDAAQPSGDRSTDAVMDEAESVEESVLAEAPEAETFGKDADAIQVAASEVIGFVYVDESVVSLGQEQNIAIGLLDETASIENARLDLESLDSEATVEIGASVIAGDTVLFAKAFESQETTAAYQLTGMRYELAGEAYYADLTVVDDTAPYVFDVVTKSVANAMEDSSEVAEDGEISAFVIGGDGELMAKESVEAAIQTADPEGVRNVEAGESIIDREMLEAGITGEEGAERASESDLASSDSVGDFALGTKSAWAAASAVREDYLFVVIDPGHGGWESGAAANDLLEKDVNLSIAQYCYNELSSYSGVTPYMTRAYDEYVGLQERVDRAMAGNADVFVSIHCNSGGGYGSEVWVPNSSSYNYGTHVDGKELGYKILAKLVALGLHDRGVKVRDSEQVNGDGPYYYPDNSIQDFYTVIEASREEGIPGIIVEHAFIDNDSDASKLGSDWYRQQFGIADATGIAEKYSLVKDDVAKSQSLVQATGHIANYGWLSNVYDQKVIGTTGKAKGLQAFRANLTNAAAAAGGITYRSYVGNAWQDWVGDGATSGTVGQDTALQAVQVNLTGDAAGKYDVWYRVHVENEGWLGWTSNGHSAGSIGYDLNAEALEIAIVAKKTAAPGDTTTPLKIKTETVSYQTHIPYTGWQRAVSSGEIAGTTGRSLPIEALKVSIACQATSGSIQYNLHCANIGWQGWRSDGTVGGTTGQGRQTEAVQIRLTGDLANKYDVYYQVHSEIFGWLDWTSNGKTAGTEGYGFSMQAIRIKLVKKGGAAGSTEIPSRKALLGYQSHVSYLGWQGDVFDGAVSGTIGAGRPIEAVQLVLRNQAYQGSIRYRVHCAYIGWQDWKNDGEDAGTTGESRQTEAIQIELTGEMAQKYDVYYRVHTQNFGWLDWASNGKSAGSEGYGYRMEAMQIMLLPKGDSIFGATSEPFKTAEEKTAIMGASQTTVIQMVKAYEGSRKEYPASVYEKYGAATIEDFCTTLKQEAEIEGVRADVVFAQAMVETGWLQFGHDVKAEQCNFAGLGATGGVPGNSFNNWGSDSVRMGLRAQVQHLKCYATNDDLKNTCVDPRWSNWLRGKAPYIEWLSIPNNPYGTGWAASPDYAASLKNIMATI